jgi:hypothetical protein
VAKSSGLERVIIYWYAVPNANKARGGWMPMLDHGAGSAETPTAVDTTEGAGEGEVML